MATLRAPDKRKHQILDAAERLFVTKGFDATSVNDILHAVGIAKGTFYHHFVSKEAVMDAIIDRYTGLIRERVDTILAQDGLSLHQKLLDVVKAAQVQGNARPGLLDELHRPENAAFHLRSQQRTLATMTPIMANLIREGVRQGVFRTDFPEEAVEMIMLYAYTVFDEMPVNSPGDRARQARAFVHHIELLLGAEAGSFRYLLQVMPG